MLPPPSVASDLVMSDDTRWMRGVALVLGVCVGYVSYPGVVLTSPTAGVSFASDQAGPASKAADHI
jgi:hypothetical protein